MPPLQPAPKLRGLLAVALAVAAVCGAMATTALAQDPAAEPAQDAASSPAEPAPSGPLKIMGWNIATSPYAIAMRKIKSSAPAWRTSFGAERRTIEAPAAPKASDIDADIVLLQGIINPRAMRRLFPARKWRLLFSPRAIDNLPKGSVFTAPVSSVEIEAIAIRYREGLRVMGRAEIIGAAADASASPGIAVRVTHDGSNIWLASVTVPASCGKDQPCPPADELQKWRQQHQAAGGTLILGGRLARELNDTAGCAALRLELTNPNNIQARQAAGENRSIFGCLAELQTSGP